MYTYYIQKYMNAIRHNVQYNYYTHNPTSHAYIDPTSDVGLNGPTTYLCADYGIAMVGQRSLLDEEIKSTATIRSLNLLQDRPGSVTVRAVQLNEDLQLNLFNEARACRLHHRLTC